VWAKHFLYPTLKVLGGTYLLPLLTTLPRRHVLGNSEAKGYENSTSSRK